MRTLPEQKGRRNLKCCTQNKDNDGGERKGKQTSKFPSHVFRALSHLQRKEARGPLLKAQLDRTGSPFPFHQNERFFCDWICVQRDCPAVPLSRFGVKRIAERLIFPFDTFAFASGQKFAHFFLNELKIHGC